MSRELDLRIAMEIYGVPRDYYHCDHPWFCCCPVLPHYSTDIREAWKVLEKVTQPPDGTFPHSANSEFMFRFQDASVWAMSAKEAAQWICETALECVSSPISITDSGKSEKPTESPEAPTPCPSSKMGMSERSCFPTSTKSPKTIRLMIDLTDYGLTKGDTRRVIRSSQGEHLVEARFTRVWIHDNECEVL